MVLVLGLVLVLVLVVVANAAALLVVTLLFSVVLDLGFVGFPLDLCIAPDLCVPLGP